jgi:hypothetical protein
MTEFEKTMEKSFAEYLSAGTAFLQILWPKMRCVGMGKDGKVPVFVQVAKAPYDIDGYFLANNPDSVSRRRAGLESGPTCRYIACEVKENAKHHTSLAIIPPGKKGTGLQYHQLEALVRVHENNGLACVVWDNAGEIGYLDGSRLRAAKSAMDTSLKAQELGYPNTAKGSRSILWGNFIPVKLNQRGVPLWIPANAA